MSLPIQYFLFLWTAACFILKYADANSHNGVWIYTEKQAYATGEDITFLAMTKEPDPLEVQWHFGDQTMVKTLSRTMVKKYLYPDRYNVTVIVSSRLGSFRSDLHIVIQKAVKLNRLLYYRSVLLDTSVPFSCRINAGTDLTFLWDFGDGTRKVGQEIQHHMFNSTGEFIIEVTAFNLVSSASLKANVFVILEPCQPPPVKNMGPRKMQVWRYQPIWLGVTFEDKIQCNISKGLHYSWSVYGPNGLPISTTGIKTNQQHLELPKYFLPYGTHKAIARVQVVGNVVYSTYSVLLEVMPSSPVSIISGGTNVFIHRHNTNFNITVDGRRSYDPDFPENILSYRWRCRPVNTAETSCFSKNVSVSSPILKFPTSSLISNCDLFKFTLTVQNGKRSSSSEMFITVRYNPISIIDVTCKDCRGNSVNWNDGFSVTAACKHCPINITYSWKLYLVNASSKSTPDVPFCSSLDVSLHSKLEEDNVFFQQLASAVPPSILNQTKTFQGDEIKITTDRFIHRAIGRSSMERHNQLLFDMRFELDNASAEMGSGHINQMDDVLFNFPVLTEDKVLSEKDLIDKYLDEQGYRDYTDFYSGIEEADSGISVGRPTGPYILDDTIYYTNGYDGDNLVDPGNRGQIVYEKTLLDLHRELIQPELFKSFTSSGLSMSVLVFKPMMLKPKSLYMLEVSASSGQVVQGKTQLFFSTYPVPEGLVCHVQPSSGFELHTHFSICCLSGKEDLLYSYSFSVGNTTKRLLYQGRDYQHYFYLPSGDPNNDYTVTIHIKIRNRFGASTKPCPVKIKVWPSFKRNPALVCNSDQELSLYGLNNLTNLIQIKNTQDIINYIFLLTATLNRLSLDPESCVEVQTKTRAALISAICQLNTTNQEMRFDILHTLVDLIKVSNQVIFDSAVLVAKYIQDLFSLRESNFSDAWVVKAVIHILSYILEAQIPSFSLTFDVVRITTNSVLMFLLSSKEPQLSVNETFIKLVAWQNYDFPVLKLNIDSTSFYISHMPLIKCTQDYDSKSCFITVIISYKQNPYHWTTTSLQLNGHVAEIKLFNCSTRREIKMRHLSTPIIIEFQTQEKRNKDDSTVEFTLSRYEVNSHHLNITTKLLKTAVHIRVEFQKPLRPAFPILLLFRMHQKPTPSIFKTRKVFHWKEKAVQFFLPASSLQDAGIAYLTLLNADYDKGVRNKYKVEKVNYTLSVDASQCLVWDSVKDWRSDGGSVLQSFTPTIVNCSYNQLSSFAVAHQKIQSMQSVSDLTGYRRIRFNPTVCLVMVVMVALYAVLLVFCNHADILVEKNLGMFLLPDNNPLDRFLYALIIDTGLRSGARMTAKVYIILYGEKGVSQTRELSNPDHTLFTPNSRTTFILSSAYSLGPVWQVCVWHDGGGTTPSWFLKHVMVRDLVNGTSWSFPAQCWLAVEEGDGRVERKLLALNRQLTFRERLNLNLTNCLKDFHPWLSVYSRPSYSTHTHTQRLSVCHLMLQAYMCANCIFIHFQEDQSWLESGLIGVSLLSVWTGLCALTLLPLSSLMSFLFRITKTNKNGSLSGDQYNVPYFLPVKGDQDALLLKDNVSEVKFAWSRVSPWKDKCQVLDTCGSEFAYSIKRTENSVPQKAADSVHGSEIIIKKYTQIKSFENTQFNLPSSSAAVNAFSKYSLPRCSRSLQSWCYYGTWALLLCLSVTCSVVTGFFSLKFSSTQCLLWIHSVFFSLLLCAFVAHPAMILTVAVFASLRHGDRGYFCQDSSVVESVTELLRYHAQNDACVRKNLLSSSYHSSEKISREFQMVLAARRRARYLRLTRPPTSTELQNLRNRIKKRRHLQKTIREMVLYVFASSVVAMVAYGKSTSEMFYLNQAVRARFTGSLLVQNLDDWWNWTEHTLLDELYFSFHDYSGTGDSVKTISLIGEPFIMKMIHTHNSSTEDLASDFIVLEVPQQCGKLQCYHGAGIITHLGKNRSEASSRLKRLWTSGWIGISTLAVKLQFTLYSPVYNLFSTVTMLGEMSYMKGVVSSVIVSSSRLLHSGCALDYCTTAGELLLLFYNLLQLYFQTYIMAQQGRRYWADLWNWIKVIVVLLSLLCVFCSVHHFRLITDIVEQLQKEDFKTFIDLSHVSSWEQFIHSLYGLLLFILLMKCCSILCLHKVMGTAVSTVRVVFSSMLWPLITAVIFGLAFSSLGNLVILPKSVYSFMRHGNLKDLQKNQASWILFCYGGLIILMSLVVKAVVTGSVIGSFVKQNMKSRRRNHHLSVSELCCYIRDEALALVGNSRQKWTVYSYSNNFVLEEFEELVDELLLKLNTISTDAENQDNNEEQSHLQSVYDYRAKVFA